MPWLRKSVFAVAIGVAAALVIGALFLKDRQVKRQRLVSSPPIASSTTGMASSKTLSGRSGVINLTDSESVETLIPAEDYHPFNVYMQYLDTAREGNPRSQYIVAKMLATCAGTTRTRERLDEIRNSGRFSDEVLLNMEKSFDRCQNFHRESEDLQTLQGTWMAAAASQGLEAAVLHQHVWHTGDKLSDQQFKDMLVPVLMSSASDQYMLEDALYFINVYFARHATWRGEQRAAWAILHCSASPECDANDFVSTRKLPQIGDR